MAIVTVTPELRHIMASHPPIPDFRFEASYFKAIGPFVHWKRPWTRQVNTHINDSDDDECRELQSNGTVSLQWSGVLWVTLRDQVMLPVVQGALWYGCDARFN